MQKRLLALVLVVVMLTALVVPAIVVSAEGETSKTITVMGLASSGEVTLFVNGSSVGTKTIEVGKQMIFTVPDNADDVYIAALNRGGFHPVYCTVAKNNTVFFGNNFYQLAIPDGVTNLQIGTPGVAFADVTTVFLPNTGENVVTLIRDLNDPQTGYLSFTYGGKNYETSFIFDGSNPFKGSLLVTFPGLTGTHIQLWEGPDWLPLGIFNNNAFIPTSAVKDRDRIRIGRDTLLWETYVYKNNGGLNEVNVPVYGITVPEGFSNVGVFINQWAYSDLNAGDTFTLIKGAINQNAKLYVTYEGKDFVIPFKLDGSNPFEGLFFVKFPGVDDVILEYYINGGWITLDETFNDFALINASGAKNIRAKKGGMSYTFDNVNSLTDFINILEVPVIQVDIIGVWDKVNIGVIGSDWVYRSAPAVVGAGVLNSYNVFGGRNYTVRLSKPGFNNIDLPAQPYTDSDNFYVYLADAYFYWTEVPDGITNVRMQSNNWIVNPANEGDTISLFKTGREAKMSFTYNGETKNVDFFLDGTDPFTEYRSVSESFSVIICDHNYEPTITANCWTGGWDRMVCSECGENDGETYGWRGALGHEYERREYNDLWDILHCTVCEHEEYSGAWAITTVAPTCTNQGYTEHHLLRTGDKWYSDYTDALGHEFGAAIWDDYGWVATCGVCDWSGYVSYEAQSGTKEPTCTLEGYDWTWDYNTDQYWYSNYVPALGHTFGDAVWDDGGWYVGPCEVCGWAGYVSYEAQSGTVEPTCTLEGYDWTYDYNTNQYWYTNYTQPLGHIWGEFDHSQPRVPFPNSACDPVAECEVCGWKGYVYTWTITEVEATCVADAYTMYVNSEGWIGYIYDEGTAFGHTWGTFDYSQGRVPFEDPCATCEICGWSGYLYSWEITDVPETCTVDARTEYLRSDGYWDKIIEEGTALGHDWDFENPDYSVTWRSPFPDPRYECKRCGYVDFAYKWESFEFEATCTADAYVEWLGTPNFPQFELWKGYVYDEGTALGHDFKISAISGGVQYCCERCGWATYIYTDELIEAIAKAEAFINGDFSKYTISSSGAARIWVENKLSELNALLFAVFEGETWDKIPMTQEILDQTLSAINIDANIAYARGLLVELADLSKLLEALDKADTYLGNAKNYTCATIEKLADAVDNGTKLAETEELTKADQAKVDAATKAINDAINGLKKASLLDKLFSNTSRITSLRDRIKNIKTATIAKATTIKNTSCSASIKSSLLKKDVVINVKEVLANGKTNTCSLTIPFKNNSSGTYTVGARKVFMEVKNNVIIKCEFVK